jgi:uncharacterized membrane protein (DUF2068 family)
MRQKTTSAPSSPPTLLRAIALFKLIKAAALVAVFAAVRGLLQHERVPLLLRWALRLHVDPDNYYLHALLAQLLALDHRQLSLLGVGALLYSLLFAAEGVGLWRGKVWAEYVTTLATGGFIPVELYELWQHATVTRGALLGLNLLIVGYLVRRLHQRRAGHAIAPPLLR